MGKSRLEKIKKVFGEVSYRSKEYKDTLDRATKLRFSSADMASKIKFGIAPLTKGLCDTKRFKALSVELQHKALGIVDEECSKQVEWAPKELAGLGRIIEKRLRKECA